MTALYELVLYCIVLYYHCPTDIHTEIKEVIIQFQRV